MDLDFLAGFPCGNATITVLLPDGTVSRINKLSPTIIGDKCPLLLYAFDDGPNGDKQASIEASSVGLVASFLRYCYTTSYLTFMEENGTCSLLKHAEISKMAKDYDVPELQVLAHVNFLRETEMSCCIPSQPIDLCEAIRFVYKHLPSQQPLIDTLLNYCVSSFKYHRLGTDANFRQVAFEIPEFHRDLCQTNFNREFQDDGASEILRLPVCRPNPRTVVLFDTDLQVEKRTHAEFQFEEWYDSGSESTRSSETGGEVVSKHEGGERIIKRRKTVTEGDFTLVYRPKEEKEVEVFSESDSSDEDGFTVVHRPKTNTVLAFEAVVDDTPSSPEAISPTPDNGEAILTAFLDASDDEAGSDWSLV